MWRTTRGEKGRGVSIRYNAGSNLRLIIKVPCSKRLAVTVNSNGPAQRRAVCFPVPLVLSGNLSVFVHVRLLLKRQQRCKGDRLVGTKTDSTGVSGVSLGTHIENPFSLFMAD